MRDGWPEVSLFASKEIVHQCGVFVHGSCNDERAAFFGKQISRDSVAFPHRPSDERRVDHHQVKLAVTDFINISGVVVVVEVIPRASVPRSIKLRGMNVMWAKITRRETRASNTFYSRQKGHNVLFPRAIKKSISMA